MIQTAPPTATPTQPDLAVPRMAPMADGASTPADFAAQLDAAILRAPELPVAELPVAEPPVAELPMAEMPAPELLVPEMLVPEMPDLEGEAPPESPVPATLPQLSMPAPPPQPAGAVAPAPAAQDAEPAPPVPATARQQPIAVPDAAATAVAEPPPALPDAPQQAVETVQAAPDRAAATVPDAPAASEAPPPRFYAPPPASPAQQMLPMLVAQAARPGGTSRLMVSLRPAELGAVEVSVVARDGAPAQVTILAERPETLALLQRDRGAIEQALQAAGIEPRQDTLNLGLSQQGQRDDRPPPRGAAPRTAAGEAGHGMAPLPPILEQIRARGLLDLAL
ncbi:flagellar hook-length control protein FliK [Roseomonas frigidaquae]|uniref:Flagellar hook-length control protein FliK n=1 Tax=Falsiroseomonas frigidaquae TaxID=487318 RepID=A0ABX1ERR1_9PROT|nr:flagellar hook-length control protein FliK [Falsiroseomonas frigidaquae]NKE43315.1 flagellar hook-length control protein FliK [Falsiroseomonas frigidaquae]